MEGLLAEPQCAYVNRTHGHVSQLKPRLLKKNAQYIYRYMYSVSLWGTALAMDSVLHVVGM